MLTLADAIEALTGRRMEGTEQPLSSVVIDSRLVTPGAMFVALCGERQDGHDFVADAFSRGAVAAIVERELPIECQALDTRRQAVEWPAAGVSLPLCLLAEDSLAALQRFATFWRTKFNARVIGVTGSVGKTMTKEMAYSVLKQRFRTLKSEGNYNNEIGLPLTLLQLAPKHERVVLEMGMYDVGEIALLAEIARPIVGVITNVGPVHLERLGTIERIAQAKSELVQALPTDGVAILNGDDPYVRPMAEMTAARPLFYGLRPDCDLWASDVQSRGLEGVHFQLHYQGETIHARVPLLGRHSVHTALRAAAIGLVEGESWEEIIGGLHNTVQLRLVVVPGANGSTLLDDTYNSSPASAIAALNLLGELEGRKISVLGDMLELGSYEEEGHRKVGRRAVDVAAILVAVGPRGRIIGEEALACGMPADRVYFAEDNAPAITWLRTVIAPSDVILVKGSRGMAMEEIVTALSAPVNEQKKGAEG
ncbi:MAG: UDP-N-acetylmuramoyl-tripeptide--D-alanyl-D-alanine ligase [Chloroflexota bacterium]|nr:UDP-N-acetylmuramoyl-tripeptide--D-alanyl-D-alanine ligase [Chloroflexota bacterium]